MTDVFFPKMNQKYFFIHCDGEMMWDIWTNDEISKARFAYGNVFKTYMKARKYRNLTKKMYLEA